MLKWHLAPPFNQKLTRGKQDDTLTSLKGQEGRCDMTVAVSCNLSDGVILGVDSAITLSGSPVGQPHIVGVVKCYEHAEKLFQLAEKPIGIATFGIGVIRARSIGSYLREFEIQDPNNVVSGSASVEDIVEELRKFFLDIYGNTVVVDIEAETGKKFDEIPAKNRPLLGLIVGGFSPGEYLSEVWRILIPIHSAKGSANLRREKGNFGSDWFATFEPIRRYIKGYDPALLKELEKYFIQLRGSPFSDSERDKIKEIIGKHEYQIPFIAMPIEEGIAHVKFLVELAINHHRFAVGAPIVGGRAKIGLVTYKGEQFKILEGG